MTDNHAGTQAVTHDDLFPQGWLDRHIDAVVTQVAARDHALRPQLTGPRAHAMEHFNWNRFTTSAGDAPTH